MSSLDCGVLILKLEASSDSEGFLKAGKDGTALQGSRCCFCGSDPLTDQARNKRNGEGGWNRASQRASWKPTSNAAGPAIGGRSRGRLWGVLTFLVLQR